MLVGADEVCKVADMGLLREVDEGDLYTAQVRPSAQGTACLRLTLQSTSVMQSSLNLNTPSSLAVLER